ncbi:MAG TPA: Ig-like domain-containing protein, partial [Acidimicrobiales bacterium]|nr:Ig-like domain-containing protein [Acidimicrobiales bacterium]
MSADSTTQINSVSWIPAASSWVAVDNIDDSVTFNGSTWSTQTNLEPIAMSSDSCVSAAFCMAVDHAGNVLSYNGTTWSAPASIDATHAIDSVSCVSTSFCVAVDGRGYEMTWGGLAWSAPTDIDASIQLNSVSCVSTTFCMAVDGGGNALEYNGSTWSAPGWSNPMDVSHIIISVSCESVNLCAAVDLSGDAMMFYGTSWVSFTPDTANQFESVSCPLSSGNPFCMAVDNAGNFTTFSGSSWSTPATVGTSSGLGSVSCTSPSFCVTTDAITNAYYFDGVSWLIQSFGASQPAVSKLSCIHGGFCAGIAFNGTASQRTTVSSWAAPAIVDTGSFTAVSCPSASECVAVDGTGDIATSNNPAGGASTWSVASNVSTNGGFTGVSCPSTTLCIAVSNRYAFWGNPSVSRPSWVSMNITGVGRLQGIDCISTTLCVAVDNSGDALFSTTPTVAASWSAPLSIDGTTALASISCDPTGALCMALDIGGSTVSSTNVSSGSSSTWTAANSITSLSGTSGLSCPSVTFCIAIDSSGQASYTLNPSAPFPTWSTAVQIESTAAITMGINCASVTSCVAVDSYGNVVVTENPQGAASAWAVTSVYSTSTGFAAVSCANTSFCAAVDQAGNVSLGIIPAASPAPTPPTTTYSLTLSPSAPTLDPGGSVTFSASLTQTTTNAATGTSTSGPVGAASISFDISSGPDAGQTFTAITNSSGMASFTYVNSGGPGVDTVTAGATNSVTGQVVIATATVTFAGQDSLTLSPTSQGAVADTSVTVSAAALDPSGAPLSGASVNFSVASGPDAGQSAIATTDSHGAATFSLSAAKAGTDSVTATLSDPKSLATVTSNQVAVNWAAPVVISPSSPSSTKPLLPGTPANLSVTLTSPASALIRQHAESLNSPGQALPKAPSALHDYLPNAASGNVADVGIPVTFSVASGPNIGQGATETTDSAGTATWSYSDTGGPGTDGVTASFTDSAGLPHSISMSVLWAPAPTTTTSTVTTLAPTTTTSPIAIVAPTTSMPSGQASTTNYSSPTTSPPAATSTGGTSSQGGSTTTVAPKVPTSTTSPGVSNHRKSSQSTTTIAPSLQALGLTPTAPAALNGNLATPQMVKALVQAGQRGPAMGYNKGYGLGSAGGPPGPVPLAQSIPSPTEAMHSFGKTAGQNSILTFLLIFLIGLPSLIFNSTLKEHHGNIASTHGAIRRFIDRIEAWLAKLHTAALLGFFAVIGSLLYAVVDPTFGFNLSSLAEIVGYVGAIILSTGVTEIARGVYVHRKFKKIGDLRAFPLGIVMAAAFDVFSRVAHFEPGFVFGILAAMVFRVEPTGEEDGRSIALSS